MPEKSRRSLDDLYPGLMSDTYVNCWFYVKIHQLIRPINKPFIRSNGSRFRRG